MSATKYPSLAAGWRLPNLWDAIAFTCVIGILVAFGHGAEGTLVPISQPGAIEVSLDPSHLPEYALRTTLRMFAALAASLLFTFTYGTAAAKSRRAALVLVPVLDVLQSVPILGFLTFTVVFFMNLFPGRVLGLELAAIFAIFTSQAWNMAFSLYQSLKTVPADLSEAAVSFHLTGWQRFWRLEVPFAVPGLVWNTMMSMSGGWFFVVASEAVTVGAHSWKLPGIGSYVALALERRNIGAVAWAILAMLLVILAYDQLLFRPLVAWSSKFRFETTAGATAADPWVLRLIRRTRLLKPGGEALGDAAAYLGGLRLSLAGRPRAARETRPSWLIDAAWGAVLLAVLAWAVWRVVSFVSQAVSWTEVEHVVLLGLITLLRVVVLMILASLVWVPIGVWLGLRPVWARRAQPLAQFLAAFPANLLFPPFVLAIVYFHLSPDVWLTPLMVLGTQWYILFNVVAGAAAFPGDLKEAAANFRIGGWLWWRKVIIPGIFPYYITGAITASGGSWNAAIVAEVASWGDTRLQAHGLGAYIADATDKGDMAKVVLGVVVMSAFVVLFNRLLWRPMYGYAQRRLTLA
ncbi:ABC transporter permease [Rhodopila globiformis]|uniref:Sulfonate ABC transporter permease n=1 Tax=Rhodopila globiformis TaxID=1071 RepID=A0A2S6NJP1_RHOGL|nr:ABC transporter permease subunit [Rhodopila globiformis]PPQ35101.1 sulfonate ABC transporter permease [Rhodopila globiformis]